ncbi:mycothione reductase [Gordonia jinghuaiqii]|uniref:Mycothione reductase n=1 Tax=Gordonia jinghuaiqii TaxID=2758710 RepID=A0A7D7QSF9_9ACTN|nr:mycothione reductase [Gordonia jinghuaiqii]MCR5976188.1 mycothione reductase [Gordonia jinghuaiqii]QMT03426.1 mycothione reductase [Gordonia jinghuaiqii]
MTATQVVDLAIIGSGSGNSIPDERFADTTIAIFEEGVYGGTCLNVGCIPTKMFVYAAEVAEIATHGARLGVHAKVDSVDWPGIVNRVFGRIDPISEGGKEYRTDRCDNITVYSSHVEFDGRDDDGLCRLVTADGATVLAREVVVAAGSRATIPPVIADSGVRYYTNNDVMRLPELPEHLIILGSGYIAAEFAHVFGALGSAVSIVARGPALLRKQDADISNRFTEVAQAKWDVHLDTAVTAAQDLPDGGVRLTLGDGTHLEADALLVATGRVPNGDRLNAGSVGIELDDEGRVRCDAHGRTAARGVWTLGDVSSPYQLKHVANHEERVVQANLLKGWDSPDLESFDHRHVPAAVFTHPQIASVGLTEEEARDQHLDIAVKVQAYGDVAYGWAMEDTTGFCKIIAERGTGRLLGAHIIGPQAPTVIQPVIQAMHFGQTAHELARGQYWIHPAMPEVLENALLGLEI